MKNTIIAIALLLSSFASAQDYFNFYIPTYTKHYSELDSNPYHNGFLGSEGGQGGLILSYNQERDYGVRSYSVGLMQNSYGDMINTWTFGRHFGNRLKFGVEGGVVFGYKKSYDRAVETYGYRPTELTGFVRETNVMPMVTGVVSYMVTEKVGIKALVSPMFVNVGLTIKL